MMRRYENDKKPNPIMWTDVYNLSHQALKCNTDWEVSHLYIRGEGEEGFANGGIFFGFRETIAKIMTIPIEQWMIDEASEETERQGLGELFDQFAKPLWQRIVDELEGYMPLQIQAVPEGLWCPTGTPVAQIRNTVEGFGEMVTWLEPPFLHNSFDSGCATRVFHMRRYLEEKQLEYGYDDSFKNRFHSFGWRGHQGEESGIKAGKAWSTFLSGTDDFHIGRYIPKSFKIGSIAALAHKVTQQWESELDCFRHAIDVVSETKNKVVAMVIDTYNADRVIDEYVLQLSVYAANKGVHCVFRPDSGDTKSQVNRIWKIVKRNNLKNVTCIIGEGMSFKNARDADKWFEIHAVPLWFVSYGIGGGYYRDIDRDYLGYAMKTAYSNGKPRMKFSMTPIKRSIPDRVIVILNAAGKIMVDNELFEGYDDENNLYETIYYHDGNLASSFVFIPDDTHMEAVQERALKQTADQDRILLSPAIHDLIETFEQKYL